MKIHDMWHENAHYGRWYIFITVWYRTQALYATPSFSNMWKIVETEGLSDLENDKYNNQIHNYDFAADYN